MNRNGNCNGGIINFGVYLLFLGINFLIFIKLSLVVLDPINDEKFCFCLAMWGRGTYSLFQQLKSFNSPQINSKKLLNIIGLYCYSIYMKPDEDEEQNESFWTVLGWQTSPDPRTIAMERIREYIALIYIIVMLRNPVTSIVRSVWRKIMNFQQLLFKTFIQCLSWPILHISNLYARNDCVRDRQPQQHPKEPKAPKEAKAPKVGTKSTPLEKSRKVRDRAVQTQPIKYKKFFLNFPDRYKPKHPPCVDKYMNTDLLCTDPFFDYFLLTTYERDKMYSGYYTSVAAQVQTIKFHAARYIIQHIDEFIANPEDFKYHHTTICR